MTEAATEVRRQAYRTIRGEGSVAVDRLLDRLAADGIDREQGRRALQQLVASDTITLDGETVELRR